MDRFEHGHVCWSHFHGCHQYEIYHMLWWWVIWYIDAQTWFFDIEGRWGSISGTYPQYISTFNILFEYGWDIHAGARSCVCFFYFFIIIFCRFFFQLRSDISFYYFLEIIPLPPFWQSDRSWSDRKELEKKIIIKSNRNLYCKHYRYGVCN